MIFDRKENNDVIALLGGRQHGMRNCKEDRCRQENPAWRYQ